MNRLVYLRQVVTLSLETEKCYGCGMCMEVCPHGVLARDNGKIRIEDRDACMECGACVRNCPAGALYVRTGVGCAAAVINAVLGRKSTSCCCVLEPDFRDTESESTPPRASSCC